MAASNRKLKTFDWEEICVGDIRTLILQYSDPATRKMMARDPSMAAGIKELEDLIALQLQRRIQLDKDKQKQKEEAKQDTDETLSLLEKEQQKELRELIERQQKEYATRAQGLQQQLNQRSAELDSKHTLGEQKLDHSLLVIACRDRLHHLAEFNKKLLASKKFYRGRIKGPVLDSDNLFILALAFFPLAITVGYSVDWSVDDDHLKRNIRFIMFIVFAMLSVASCELGCLQRCCKKDNAPWDGLYFAFGGLERFGDCLLNAELQEELTALIAKFASTEEASPFDDIQPETITYSEIEALISPLIVQLNADLDKIKLMNSAHTLRAVGMSSSSAATSSSSATESTSLRSAAASRSYGAATP